MHITDNIWIDPKQVTAMIIESGSDNYTLGITIKVGEDKYYISHNSHQSVFDIQRKIIAAREGV